jgi:predicted RNA-binding protein with PUA-like domain
VGEFGVQAAALVEASVSSDAGEGGLRAMAYWLLKSEPDDWSWTEQVAKGRDGAEWTGIRNLAAQKYLRAMKRGERAFFYHTGKERAIIGIVEVIAEAHPDSTDSAWCAVDVAAVEPLPTPVGLDRVKADKRLAGMVLARQPRLSVQPVTDAEWGLVCKMGGLG